VVINNFEIPKTGNYLLQLRMTPGIGGSALNLNGTAPEEGVLVAITDVTVAPGDPDERSYLAIPYSTLVAQQALDGSAAGSQISLSVIIPYNAGRILDVIYTPTGAPTGGLITYDIIQMC
jgi:hypothetical protein